MSHKPVRPSRPPKRGLKPQVKAVNSLLTPFYSVIDADSAEPGRYAPRESLRYAIVHGRGRTSPGTSPLRRGFQKALDARRTFARELRPTLAAPPRQTYVGLSSQC